jgi:tRNA modification GTPase
MEKSRFNLTDTIAAISTPLGGAGIGIIRISGQNALKIADRVFISKSKKRLPQFKTHTVNYGLIVDGSEVIDEVLLTVMRSPNSFTTEDVVEINCHGGIVPTRKILDLVVNSGARIAEPGEFTKRAFLNGRIDLAQAEAVLDIINAKTEAGLKIAVDHLEGDLSKKIKKLRLRLLDIISLAEASIDFTESDIEPINIKNLKEEVGKSLSALKKLLDSSNQGIVLNEGVTAVICGRANVGKSSLMNALIKKEKVIVTPLAGTTRDAIEELINLKGIPLKLVDTAGILKSAGPIEKESMKRGKNYLKNADLIILMLDNSEPVTAEDRYIVNLVKGKQIIVVINKIDLPANIDLDKIKSFLQGKRKVEISALKGTNLDKLEEMICEIVFRGEVAASPEPIINNIRHKTAARDASLCLNGALESIEKGLSIEFIVEDIKEAVKNLGRITGETTPDEILDKIFSRFCIGK